MVWGNQTQGLAHIRQVSYTDWHCKPSFYLYLNCRTSFDHSVHFINITQYAYGMYPFCGWDNSVHFLDGTEFHWIDILLIFFSFSCWRAFELFPVWRRYKRHVCEHAGTCRTCLPYDSSCHTLGVQNVPWSALGNTRETAEKHCITVHSFQPRRKCCMAFPPEDVVFIRVFTIRSLCVAVQSISFHCPMS